MRTQRAVLRGACLLSLFVTISIGRGCGSSGTALWQPTEADIPNGMKPAHRAAVLLTFSKQAAERKHGAIILGNIGRNVPAVIPFLIRLLPDGETVKEDSIDAYEDLISTDRTVSRSAKDSLTWIGRDAVPSLIVALQSPRAPIKLRSDAAWMLGALGDCRASPALMDAAQMKDSDLQWAAIYSLGKIHEKRAAARLVMIAQDPRQDTLVRRVALRTLGKIVDASEIVPLTKIACDSAAPADVREAAVDALGILGNPQSLPVLLKLVDSTEGDLQAASTLALGGFSSEIATRRLEAILEEQKAAFSLRLSAGRGLARSKDPAALKRLLHFLRYDNDVDPVLRCRLTCVVAAGNDKEALEFVFRGLRQEKSAIRESSVEALQCIQSPRAVSMLVSVLRDAHWFADETVKFNGFFALLCIRTTESARALTDMACDVRLPLESRVRALHVVGLLRLDEILPQLARLVTDPDNSIRSALAVNLGLLGAPSASRLLRRLLDDSDANVRSAANDSLVLLGEEP